MIDLMQRLTERVTRRDAAIAAVVSALGTALMVGGIGEQRGPGAKAPDFQPVVDIEPLLPLELAVPLFLLVTVPVLWRRVAPVPAAGAALVGLVVNQALVGTGFIRCAVVLLTAGLLAFAAASRRDGRAARIGLVLCASMVALDFSVGFGVSMAVVAVGVTAAVWSAGRFAAGRRRVADELRATSAQLRIARDERARLEVAADRSRLSRELDELLQRRLGRLAAMADADARPADADAAAATLAGIERESRHTLEDMRAAVGVLRTDDAAGAPTAPQPTLAHLEALLQARRAQARLVVEGSPRVLPAAVELSAYRIVEHLLDGLEDDPDVEVRVRFADDALELVVRGPARRRTRPSVARARERARLEQGTVETRVREGRTETVASLPVLSTV